MNNKKEITPQTIAKYFLSKEQLTPKRAQKLVYYAYAWFITLNNEDENNIKNKLFDESPEAWMHGPVFRSLYEEYESHGWKPIKKEKTIPKIIADNKDLKVFLERIWELFGKYDADALEYMSHQEDPWKKARIEEKSVKSKKNQISDSEIFRYYNALAERH
ncbi:SocA family protein [Candidatus Saccharibacteria bacterium]|nr:SocA family protein [Candidatus Saccharibacteria bacterium]